MKNINKNIISVFLIAVIAIHFGLTVCADTYVMLPVMYSEEEVQAITDRAELSSSEIAQNIQNAAIFGGTLRSNPTTRYNCHSYAWYSRNVETNQYWIDDPTNFYSNGKYEEVTAPQVGDIICYFDDRGTTTTADDMNLHSGVVTMVLGGTFDGSVDDTNRLVVWSKWGKSGLYQHNGYKCPYTPYVYEVGLSFPATAVADYVKFYRAHELQETSCTISGIRYSCENCSYTVLIQHLLTYTSTPGNLIDHTASCERCGYTCVQAHQWRDLGSRYRCLGCNMTAAAIPVLPNQLPNDQLKAMQLRLSVGQTTLTIDANTVLCYRDGQYYLVKATSEEAALQVVNGLKHEIS